MRVLEPKPGQDPNQSTEHTHDVKPIKKTKKKHRHNATEQYLREYVRQMQ